MAEGAETLRSRLYRLQNHNGEETWVERGQGFPEFKREEVAILRFFSIPGRVVVYEATVDTNIQFQRSENGIQWTQVRENEVMAISFKEQFSANAFWQLIEEYQRKYAISVPAADGIYFYFEYKVPDPTPENLSQVLAELENIPEAQRHERVSSIFLTKRDMLPRLLGAFKRVEEGAEEGREEQLERLFGIVKIVFNAANEELFYELLCNQSFMGVLGILEHDPNFRNCQTKHRDFMSNKAKLLEVVPFRSAPELLNLVVFTYRLEYVRECVLFPYLNDNGFGSSACIIRNNYKKILLHIFNPKRKEFINSLYDLLRLQDPQAFKMLREIFRIARIYYMPEVYTHIAERDTFEIFFRNMKELLQPIQQPTSVVSKKKKRTPQELRVIVEAALEIVDQFMEHEPQHLRNYLLSESEKTLKYPEFEFLLAQFQHAPIQMSNKLGAVLKSLLGVDPHPLKETFKERILESFLACEDVNQSVRWMPLLSQIIIPFNDLIAQKISLLLDRILPTLSKGSKADQILHIATLRLLVHNYIVAEPQVENLLIPRAPILSEWLCASRGGEGIRVSAFLCVLQPPRFRPLLHEMIGQLSGPLSEAPLASRYQAMLTKLSQHKEVVLPAPLKRQKSEQYLDEQNFDKLSKKIKID